ncbi:MFS general substrate transporter [Exidia glandulosa HHB12029]|uniref:MFS general substrate transporter n=1 Tax=Exidia glandulosa HHB12029 TaxID=1314781 RepID=A0A165KPU6_EXIGL|nr:MFS general substrate transporter [Exidia glandulosa HHB12029]
MRAPYFIRNLVPRREQTERPRPLLVALRDVTPVQWGFFIAGWMAWTCDAMDFFTVSLSVTNLQTTFNRPAKSITASITLTLLFRSLGAVIFGIISDRYGRKWPLVASLLFCAVLELATGFVKTFAQFLAVRALFGIAMGSVWGMAASNALENLPVEVRGLASGIMQQGYDFGYMLAALVNLYLVPAHPGASWRALFWTAAGCSAFAAAFRMLLPESEVFLRAAAEERERERTSGRQDGKTKVFMRESSILLKHHWKLCVYAVLLMAGFNFLSHGSGDLFPTYMQTTKGFTARQASISTIIASSGAIAGGAVAGWASQYIGRRLTIVICLVLTGAFVPLWILPSTFGKLTAGAFWISFGIHGAFGVIPIFLSELSPPGLRALFGGVAYQLGNMISSASAQIEATGGDNLRTTVHGKDVPDYATVQGIFIGTVLVYTIILAIVGPEKHSSHFERDKLAFQEGAAREDTAAGSETTDRRESADEKDDPEVLHQEKV